MLDNIIKVLVFLIGAFLVGLLLGASMAYWSAEWDVIPTTEYDSPKDLTFPRY